MARFLGTDKNEFIDNQRVEGGFFDLLDAGMAFFFKHNLTNSIAIYDDRIEIANPGVFPRQLTPETIKDPHESYPYNLKIAEALYKSTLLENWGSGAKRIMDACREQGVEEPTWRWDGGFVYVIFKRPAQGHTAQETAQQPANNRSTSDQQPINFRPSTPQVEKLIQSLDNRLYSMTELMDAVGLKHRTTFRGNYFLPALNDGLLEMLYPDVPNHRNQKYRLTDKGLAFYYSQKQQ